MLTQAIGFVITALFVPTAPAQAPVQRPAAEPGQERVLSFANGETEQNVQEIATLIGAVAAIRKIAPGSQQGSLTMHGTPDQIAAA
jgi:hypothetical protein